MYANQKNNNDLVIILNKAAQKHATFGCIGLAGARLWQRR